MHRMQLYYDWVTKLSRVTYFNRLNDCSCYPMNNTPTQGVCVYTRIHVPLYTTYVHIYTQTHVPTAACTQHMYIHTHRHMSPSVRTLPASTVSVSMTMVGSLYSHTILQKSLIVSSRGPVEELKLAHIHCVMCP